MQTERGLDRLTFFTDAIAAIAITLLILPLVDRVVDFAGSPTQFLADNHNELVAFALSFLLIARFWMSHHSLFEHVVAYTTPLRNLSLAWAFTIVLLTLPSAMISHWESEPVLVGFYIGTLTANSAILTSMLIVVRRHPVIESTTNPVDPRRLWSSALTTGEFVVALLVGTLVPSINYWALVALAASWPINAVVNAATARRVSKESHA